MSLNKRAKEHSEEETVAYIKNQSRKLEDKLLADKKLVTNTSDSNPAKLIFRQLNKVVEKNLPIKKKPHKTITLSYKEKPVEIDTAIAPLMSEIWVAGLKTISCCEDDTPNGYVMIQFETADDCKDFLNICFTKTYTTGDVYCRAFIAGEHETDAWSYQLKPIVTDQEEDESGMIAFACDMTVTVRFPAKDYYYVYKKFQALNDNTDDNTFTI